MWNGSVWSIEHIPVRGGNGPNGYNLFYLGGVSCTSRRACLAVGANPQGALVERWNGRTWLVGYIHHPDLLDAVSCASAERCIATKTLAGPTVLSWNGQRWSLQNSVRPRGISVNGVSCAAAVSCDLAGTYGNSALVEHCDGRRWSRQPTPHVKSRQFLQGISCARGDGCTAVGQLGPSNLIWPALIEQLP